MTTRNIIVGAVLAALNEDHLQETYMSAARHVASVGAAALVSALILGEAEARSRTLASAFRSALDDSFPAEHGKVVAAYLTEDADPQPVPGQASTPEWDRFRSIGTRIDLDDGLSLDLLLVTEGNELLVQYNVIDYATNPPALIYSTLPGGETGTEALTKARAIRAQVATEPAPAEFQAKRRRSACSA